MTPRIAVAVASSGHCKTQFAMSFAGMMAYFSAKPLAVEGDGQEISQFCVESSGLAHNQNQLVRLAREWKATHIMWVEDDMQFPPDSLHRLFAWRQPWVGANYAMRAGPPFEYVALGLDKKRVFTGAKSSGLEEVLYTGYGCTLMEMSIFDKIEKPYFEHKWVGDDVYCTTDAYLSDKLRSAGVKIYVDHDLSKQVGHVGSHVYKCLEVEAWKNSQLESSNGK